jgi:hypothetical protein
MGSPRTHRRIASRRFFWSCWEIGDVRYEVESGKHMLSQRFSGSGRRVSASDWLSMDMSKVKISDLRVERLTIMLTFFQTYFGSWWTKRSV